MLSSLIVLYDVHRSVLMSFFSIFHTEASYLMTCYKLKEAITVLLWKLGSFTRSDMSQPELYLSGCPRSTVTSSASVLKCIIGKALGAATTAPSLESENLL